MPQEAAEDLRWGVVRRFEFIEWRAYWVGWVNRKDLEDVFDISTPQASVDLRNYQEAAPGNIEYDATGKAYIPTRNFNPKFLNLSPERYLVQLQALANNAIRKGDTWFDELPPVDVIPPIFREPHAFNLRPLLRAIEMRGKVSINYQSLTSRGMRTICPHALAHDGYRWHTRAWSVEREQFRDYVLGRILSISEPTACTSNPADDVEWQTFFTLRLIAHPGLNESQRATVEHDYRLEGGELAIKMRLALAYYFVKRHNLDLRSGQIEPARAQLFLKNFEEYEAAGAAARERSQSLVKARRSAEPIAT